MVVAYGLDPAEADFGSFPLGCFNLHASLLPRWRGAAPIHRAIMAGDAETGVMVMKMDEGLDTGPIAMAERVAIGPDATTGELHDQLARLGAELMLRALGALERGGLQLTPQPAAGATYAPKIDKNETRIDWSRPWQQVHDHCRGLSPFPGAWCEFPGAGRVKVLRTTKGDGNGKPGRGARRPADDRVRRGRRAAGRTAARRRQADGVGKNFCAGCRSRPVACWPDAPDGVRRRWRPCRATSSPSNMTARRSSAGRCRTTARRCRACSTDAVAAFTGERAAVHGAGRTDAGVHALGQVAHVDLAKDWDADTVRDALNAHLRPHPVAVLEAERVADTFEARFSAIKRHYLYRIVNRRADLALDLNRAWRMPRPLDSTRCTPPRSA